MAQHEQDREDLLREATALTSRAEIKVGGYTESVVVGFRSNGAASVFVGADPVYQFNSVCELRRGFRDGQLIKAVDGKLFTMRRERKDGQVQLLRSELSPDQVQTYLVDCQSHLANLLANLQAEQFEMIGQVPSDEDVITRIVEWLEAMPEEIAVAAKPNVA